MIGRRIKYGVNGGPEHLPIVIDSQRVARSAQSLPFCYLCGKDFTAGDEINRDHVPPSGLFEQGDRDFPLILPTHKPCNSSQSEYDQLISQIVGLVRGREPGLHDRPVEVVVGQQAGGAPIVGIVGVDIRAIVRRWVRGFHAALYCEYLPENSEFSTCTPLPEGDRSRLKDGFDPIPAIVPEFVKELKKNRMTGTLDRVVCRNGKCVYECVWSQADRGQWLCIYGLDLYGWIQLGDPQAGPRGCVGSYRRPGRGTPRSATCGTQLTFPIPNQEPNNPFGS